MPKQPNGTPGKKKPPARSVKHDFLSPLSGNELAARRFAGRLPISRLMRLAGVRNRFRGVAARIEYR